MGKKEIWDSLSNVFREIFEDDELEIGPETTANDIPDWDSLTHIQLLVAVEQMFKMRFNTGEVASLKNVGEMVELIEKKSSANG